METQWCFIIHF